MSVQRAKLGQLAGRALVLGGGGVTGIAWMLGLLAGLEEHGLSLSDADLVVGTSAGSVVGVQVAGDADLEAAYASQLAEPHGEIAANLSPLVVARLILAAVLTHSPEAYARRVGRVALSARTVSEAERRAVFSTRLSTQTWPERPLAITAVDTESGAFTVFDRQSGVPLVDAVAASCAVPGVWPPVTINGRRFMDGGMRSPANLPLAAGYARVVVLAPLTQALTPGTGVLAQAAELRRGGSQVVVLSPDAAARRAIGRNVLDPSHRAAAARAGRAQAVEVADSVRQVWIK